MWHDITVTVQVWLFLTKIYLLIDVWGLGLSVVGLV